MVITQFATAKAGLILVNINPAYRLTELEHALRKSGCVALITATKFKDCDYTAMIRKLMHGERLPELRIIIQLGNRPHPGMMSFRELSSAVESMNTEDWTNSPGLPVRRPHQHPVHQWHNRPPKRAPR